MFRGVVLIAIVTLASASVSADEKADKALQALQGEWKVDGFVFGGESASPELIAKLAFTIKDNQMVPSDDPKDVATIKLDPERKPAWFDSTDRSKKTMLGIYELSGDTLRICSAAPGAERPKEFASAQGSGTAYVVLKRASK